MILMYLELGSGCCCDVLLQNVEVSTDFLFRLGIITNHLEFK